MIVDDCNSIRIIKKKRKRERALSAFLLTKVKCKYIISSLVIVMQLVYIHLQKQIIDRIVTTDGGSESPTTTCWHVHKPDT